jgi:uroporphyrinogen decarboxylase
MENILCEMMLRPDRMRRLLAGFTEYHKKVMTGLAAAGAHGYFTSDDLGSQETLIFSRELLLKQYLPLYEELVDHCHSVGMHFWLHACGAITDILDDLVSIGVDVIHPIQPVAMDQEAVAREYGSRITFLAGIDVQYLLPAGSREDVACGTRKLIDTFDREQGGCILAASNGIMPETPLENIKAWLETAESYGRERRERYRRSG